MYCIVLLHATQPRSQAREKVLGTRLYAIILARQIPESFLSVSVLEKNEKKSLINQWNNPFRQQICFYFTIKHFGLHVLRIWIPRRISSSLSGTGKNKWKARKNHYFWRNNWLNFFQFCNFLWDFQLVVLIDHKLQLCKIMSNPTNYQLKSKELNIKTCKKIVLEQPDILRFYCSSLRSIWWPTGTPVTTKTHQHKIHCNLNPGEAGTILSTASWPYKKDVKTALCHFQPQ